MSGASSPDARGDNKRQKTIEVKSEPLPSLMLHPWLTLRREGLPDVSSAELAVHYFELFVHD